MHILLVCDTKIPVDKYGGTERIMWWLAKHLLKKGHRVSFLAKAGSTCPFADVFFYRPWLPVRDQIPAGIDLVHSHMTLKEPLKIPHLVTHHGNFLKEKEYDINTVFVSRNHAERNGAVCYVYNGIDPEEYGEVDWGLKRSHLLFLGYAKRPEKNLADCVRMAGKTGERLAVIGGRRKWHQVFSRVQYKGFLGKAEKSLVINESKALLFPVRWHEPFGLAIIESLYFGAPVIGSRYGSLPELIGPEAGFLSNSVRGMTAALKDLDRFDRRRCHEYVLERFTAERMTEEYLQLYRRVLNGEPLNPAPPVNRGNFIPGELLPLEP